MDYIDMIVIAIGLAYCIGFGYRQIKKQSSTKQPSYVRASRQAYWAHQAAMAEARGDVEWCAVSEDMARLAAAARRVC